MGTSLTGTKPKDTYDSLIKVGDNGPISGTAKYLSDGLGNDLPIAVSTSNVGIGTSSPTRPLTIQGPDNGEGQLRLQGTGSTTSYSEIGRESLSTGQFRIKLSRNGTVITPLVIDDTTGNVGIGKTSPSNALHIGKAAVSLLLDGLKVDRDPSTSTSSIFNAFGGSTNIVSNSGVTSSFTSPIVFSLSDNTTTTEIARITSNGLTFNGDTAAANALDDYEEGTFTLSFGGASTAGTYTPTAVNATYTKIGRVVTLQYKAAFTSGASGGSGYMQISGLPFAYAANSGGLTSSIILSDASWGGSYLSLLPVSSGSESKLLIVETAPSTGLTNFVQAGDFNTSTDIRFTLTYQV